MKSSSTLDQVQTLNLDESIYYFSLFANVIPIKGAKRAALYDLQRGYMQFAPNLLLEVLSVAKEKTIYETKVHFNHQ